MSDLSKRKKMYLFSIVLCALLIALISGILLGFSAATGPFDEVSTFVKQSELDSESFLIEQDLLKNFGAEECNLAASRLDSLGQELGSIGRQLSDPTLQQHLGPDSYHHLKTKYHLLQIRTYLFFKKMRESCETPLEVILFYYSNNDDSMEQGYILDGLVAENPNLHVFAVQSNYTKEISFLESFYNITVTPSLIINYNYKVSGKADMPAITPLLKNG